MAKNIRTENEQIEGQESIETLEGGKYMPESLKQKAEPKKKAGRPKLKNREKKARYTFTITPSLYEKAQTVAYENGKSLSELIADFLTEYVSLYEKSNVKN